MRIGLHDEGLVLLTPEIPGEPSEAVRRASGGPIFSLAREKIGEKRVLGRVWCLLRVQFRRGPEF